MDADERGGGDVEYGRTTVVDVSAVVVGADFFERNQSNKTADIKPCERTWFKHESISVGL